MNKIEALKYLVGNFNPISHGCQYDEWQEASMYTALRYVILSPDETYTEDQLNALLIEVYDNA